MSTVVKMMVTLWTRSNNAKQTTIDQTTAVRIGSSRYAKIVGRRNAMNSRTHDSTSDRFVKQSHLPLGAFGEFGG